MHSNVALLKEHADMRAAWFLNVIPMLLLQVISMQVCNIHINVGVVIQDITYMVRV